jgi:hypothetical protein
MNLCGTGLIVNIILLTPVNLSWIGGKINYEYFNQWGGLNVTMPPLFKGRIDSAPLLIDRCKLEESPWYYWKGGKKPVPDNVELIIRYPISGLNRLIWEEIVTSSFSVSWGYEFAFKLTGKVL